MDYKELRDKGIQQLQSLSGERWTDHNAHDPGITLLEQLCFALTDLNYRAEFPIEDLLAEGGATPWTDNFRPRPMLTTGPVSLQDWRMLFLDLPGVKNVWLKPIDTAAIDYPSPLYYDQVDGSLSLESMVTKQYAERLSLKGLYQIDYVLEEEYNLKNLESQVTTAIQERFQAHRNLCEDIYKITRLQEYPVSIEARIEITADPDPSTLLAKINAQINNYFRPSIRFYTLQEMLDKGYLMDEIMTGPQLDHGFLEPEELGKFSLTKSLRISDLIALIMEIEGVVAVHSLKLSADQKVASTLATDSWELMIPTNRVASLRILPETNSTSPIQLWHQGIERKVEWSKSWHTIQTLLQKEKAKNKKREAAELDYEPPTGTDRQVKVHQSIVHQFPDLYGIGINGLPQNSSPRRQAQAKQLKAYLSFFDQLLANSFAQLGAVRNLFGQQAGNSNTPQTYFTQSLVEEFPGFQEVVDSPAYQALIDDGASDEQTNELRQKRLTQHLLARLAERFTDFSQQGFEQQNISQQAFLQHYAELGYKRFKAFDYTSENVENQNISGLEQRLNYLLGFPEQKPASLASLTAEDTASFHLVEHLLLRPGTGDTHQASPMLLLPFNGDDQRPPQKDPYSLQLSFVFPNWTKGTAEDSYWHFLATTIREQTPAHLKIYIHRLNPEQMAAFEAAFNDWLLQLKPTA